jgi:hypothetical protein
MKNLVALAMFAVVSVVGTIRAEDYYVIRKSGTMNYLYNINPSEPKLVKTSATEKVEESPLKIVKGKTVLSKTIYRTEEQVIVPIDSFLSFTLTRGQYFYPNNYDTTVAIDTIKLVVAMCGVVGRKILDERGKEHERENIDKNSFLPKTYVNNSYFFYGERKGKDLLFGEEEGVGRTKINDEQFVFAGFLTMIIFFIVWNNKAEYFLVASRLMLMICLTICSTCLTSSSLNTLMFKVVLLASWMAFYFLLIQIQRRDNQKNIKIIPLVALGTGITFFAVLFLTHGWKFASLIAVIILANVVIRYFSEIKKWIFIFSNLLKRDLKKFISKTIIKE